MDTTSDPQIDVTARRRVDPVAATHVARRGVGDHTRRTRHIGPRNRTPVTQDGGRSLLQVDSVDDARSS